MSRFRFDVVFRAAAHASKRSLSGVRSRAQELIWLHGSPKDTAPVGLTGLKEAVGDLQDALLRVESGTALRRASLLATKLGAGSAFSGALLGAASLFGTASTGTAIGTLSGAAFSSAALAWIGGSVAVGSTMLAGGSIIVGLGAYFGARSAWNRFLVWRPRSLEELDEEEKRLVRGLQGFLVTLTRLERETEEQPGWVYGVACREVLNPVAATIEERLQSDAYASWPILSRRRLRRALGRVRQEESQLFARRIAELSVPIGTVSAVLLKLIGDATDNLSERDNLVLGAVRRANLSLSDASTAEIGEYVKSLSAGQLAGLQNSIKGIYHELAFEREEDDDGDEYVVDLFDQLNHKGADVVLRNMITGDEQELQLKATDHMSHIMDHRERYPDIPIMTTEEMAVREGLQSSGFANAELTADVEDAFAGFGAEDEIHEILGTSLRTGLTASLVTFFVSAGSTLRSGRKSGEEDGTTLSRSSDSLKIAGSIALLTELLS